GRQRELDRALRYAGIGVTSALAIFAFAAWRSAVVASDRLDKAISMTTGRVDDAARWGDWYGVPNEVITNLLDNASGDFAKVDAPTASFQLAKARVLIRLSDAYWSSGNDQKSKEFAARARALLEDM